MKTEGVAINRES